MQIRINYYTDPDTESWNRIRGQHASPYCVTDPVQIRQGWAIILFKEQIVYLWTIRSFLKNGPFFNERFVLFLERIVH